MDRLAAVEPRLARVVECRFFGGLSEEETAEALGVTTRTVQRDWARRVCCSTGAFVVNDSPLPSTVARSDDEAKPWLPHDWQELAPLVDTVLDAPLERRAAVLDRGEHR